MANDLTNIMPKILARSLMVLREQCMMPRVVNGDYSSEAAKKGQTIDVPIPTANSATDVVPGPTYASATDADPGLVQISLDQWKQSNFGLSDKELVEIDRNEHFLPMQVGEAIRALSNAVNQNIHSHYTGVFGYVGTAGTTPFASTVNAATDARKQLHTQLAPRSERRGVLNFDAEANALALPQFSDVEKVGSTGVKIEGEVGRKYGIDWLTDDNVVTHTAGSIHDPGALVAASAVAGASALTIAANSATGTYNMSVGDVFSIAGNTQTYAVQGTVSAIASAASGGKAISIDPPLVVDAASAAVITVRDDHVVNLVFHRDAFAFANRPLVQSTQDMALGSQIMSMTDPQTGITLRLEVSRQYKQVRWEFDMLWGSKLVRPQLATRLAG